MTGHYDRESFFGILRLVAEDENVDALAVATAGGPHVAVRIEAAARVSAKPVVVCWTGGLEETEGLRALRASPVPLTYRPTDCARLLASLAAWTEARRRAAEAPVRSRDPTAWAKLGEAI